MNALSCKELLRYTDQETERWRAFLSNAGPEILDVPIDTAGQKDVRGVLLHIFAVELRYSERLLETEVTAYDKLPTGSLDELYGIHIRARRNIDQWLAKTNDRDMEKVLTFPTITAGTLTASKRKCLVHSLLHGVRHWAQMANTLRIRGHKQDWMHDFLMTDAME